MSDRRWFLAVSLPVAIVVAFGLVVLPAMVRRARPRTPTPAAIVLRVDALAAQVNALEMAAAAKKREDALLLAEVVRLQAEVVRTNQRLQAIERVVPVQAIRDRAAQR